MRGMMNKLIGCFSLMLMLLLGCSGEGVLPEDATRRFFKVYGRIDPATAGDVQPTAAGGFLLAGSLSREVEVQLATTEDQDLYLLRTGPEGNLLSSQRWGRSDRRETAVRLLPRPAGGYMLLANLRTEADTLGHRFALYQLDRDGAVTDSTLLPPSAANFTAVDMVATPEGDYVVLGSTDSLRRKDDRFAASDASDIFLLRLSPSGNLRWLRLWGQAGADAAVDLLALADGSLIVLLNSADENGQTEALLLRCDAAGQVQGLRRLSDTGTGGAFGAALLAWPDPQQVLLAYNQGATCRLLPLDGLLRDGGLSAQNLSAGNSLLLQGVDLATTADGGLILAANAFETATQANLALLRFAPDLSEQWRASFGDFEDDRARAVLPLDAPAGFALTGTLGFGPNRMITLIRTDSLGRLDD